MEVLRSIRNILRCQSLDFKISGKFKNFWAKIKIESIKYENEAIYLLYVAASMMQIAIIFLYGGSSLFQVYLMDSYIYFIIPYLGIIFPNILLLRMLQEMNTYEIQGSNELVIFNLNKRQLDNYFFPMCITFSGTGVQWSNMFRIAETSYSAAGSIGVMMIFSIIGTILHFILSIYIYTIFPGKFRTQEHPLYFLKVHSLFNIFKENKNRIDTFIF